MPESELDRFRVQVEEYAARFLEEYTRDTLPLIEPSTHGKEFNDPVWQTIRINSLELLLLDSPLFQRLRHLRQLGVIHWVYSGATHTRFEHTLGVVSRVQEIIDSINAARPERSAVIQADMAGVLRLAALCHDLGHGFMSHVSENALSGAPATEKARNAFCEQFYGMEHIQLSEMAAYHLVGSPAFKSLLAAAMTQAGTSYSRQAPALAQLVQKIIVGQQIDDEIPLLHEFISGPFDADKLDYMTRDAHMAGVPAVTDIPRMIQKMRAERVDKKDLPEKTLEAITGDAENCVITGIALSGGRTLDELMLGRALLFDKIYRHQKVRAIEGMVALLVRQLAGALPAETPEFALPYLFLDEEILFLEPDVVRQRLGLPVEAEDKTDRTDERRTAIEVACQLSRALRERRLFVRAFAFALATPLDSLRHSPAHRLAMDRIIRDCKENASQVGLIQKIASETRAILETLSVGFDNLAACPSLEAYIWVDPPRNAGSAAQIARALLISPNKKVMRFRDESAEMRTWSDAYLQTNDIGYVFCVRELREYVYLATEKVFLETYQVRIDDVIFHYAKQRESEINEVRSKLAAKGYYRNSLRSLWPVPARLKRNDVQTICTRILANLQGYDGPEIAEDDHRGPGKLNLLRIRDWVGQFREEGPVDVALRVVNKLRLIGRADAVEALRGFLQQHPEFLGAAVCSLGMAKDSGSIMAYYAPDLKKECQIDTFDLAIALKSGRPVIFFDDIIGSGQQLVNVLHDRLGLEQPFALKETPRPALDAECRKLLRERKIAFVCSTALNEGRDRLAEYAGKLNLAAPVHVGIPQERLPTVFDDDLKPTREEAHEQFIEHARRIGKSLLLDPGKGHDEAWCANKCLGYGDLGLLIVFPYNTPSQTLTCLWSSGQYENAPWQPLLPRRKKE